MFTNFGLFLTKSWVFIPRKVQKTLQKSSFWCHLRYVTSLYSLSKTPFFGALKFKYIRNRLDRFKKWAHSEILPLRAFKWSKSQIILIKFQFYSDQNRFRKYYFFWTSAYISLFFSGFSPFLNSFRKRLSISSCTFDTSFQLFLYDYVHVFVFVYFL